MQCFILQHTLLQFGCVTQEKSKFSKKKHFFSPYFQCFGGIQNQSCGTLS